MGSMIVIQFTTLDGVVEDPDGFDKTERGGWAFRYGPQAVAGDKFKLGEVLDTGVLLMGRTTWEHFSQIWPNRSDEFSTKMNHILKLVMSRTLKDVTRWSNSRLLRGDLVEEVSKFKGKQDMVLIGSGSVVRTLMDHDAVDEYRLLVFPTVIGEGRRLFPTGIAPIELELASAERSGAAVLLTYRRVRKQS